MSIEDVAGELYGLAPEDFTAARNARAKRAKAEGDAELAAQVQSLRKPTAGAWLLNQLVRRHGEEVQQVLGLGARLRAAQGTLGADELRDLDRQRRQLTREVAERARTLGRDAGRRVTDQTTADVEETLRSAMVDAAAGAALATGRLTDTFSSTGLEPVDLARVVALPGPQAQGEAPASENDAAPVEVSRPDAKRQRLVADAERAVAQAGSALEAARAAVDEAEQQLELTQRQREGLESEREEARRRWSDLDAQVASANEAEEAATRERARVQQEETSAAEGAARLVEALDALRDGGAGTLPASR